MTTMEHMISALIVPSPKAVSGERVPRMRSAEDHVALLRRAIPVARGGNHDLASEQLKSNSTHVRDVMSMVPTSVTVVAGQPELTGERAALIVGSFVFISLQPCLIGFFVSHDSTSWPQLNGATVLGISTLASGQTDFCRKLGKKEHDRFADAFWTQGNYGAPLVAGAVATIECQIENVTPLGDHNFVLARALDLSTGPVSDPLIFQNHGFSGLIPR